MTTIAWDGRILAGDKQRSMNNTPMPTTKVFRATRRADPAMMLYGCAGDSTDCIAFQRWVKGGEKPLPKNLNVLAVDERGACWFTDESLVWVPIEMPCYAIGTGGEFAIGAMVAGKSAQEAVEIASQWDVHSGGGVDVLELAP